jgi:hypothetical protein
MRQRAVNTVFFALCSLGLVGAGVFVLVTQQSGTPAEATVTDCQRRARAIVCTGTWTVGELIDGGRVVRGTIDGVSSDAVGQTIPVRLSGDRAYTTSLRLPLILIGSGVLVAVLAGFELRRSRHGSSGRA